MFNILMDFVCYVFLCIMVVIPAECMRRHNGCVYLNIKCLDYSCYQNCYGISFKGVERDSLKVCGNSTFTSCFMKQHVGKNSRCAEHYRRCIHVNGTHFVDSDEDGATRAHLAMVLLTSFSSVGFLILLVVYYCRFYTRSQVKHIKQKCYSIELKNDSSIVSSDAQCHVSWVETSINENMNTIQNHSIWNNIYMRKLQDYETSEDENYSSDENERERGNNLRS